MTGPVPSWQTAPMWGTWRNVTPDGALKAGSYVVSLLQRVVNVTDDCIFPAGTFASGTLQTADDDLPSLSIDMPLTDDPDNSPAGWKCRVVITFADGSKRETYEVQIPAASLELDPPGVNLRTAQIPALG